jgi:hypothetical protein
MNNITQQIFNLIDKLDRIIKVLILTQVVNKILIQIKSHFRIK